MLGDTFELSGVNTLLWPRSEDPSIVLMAAVLQHISNKGDRRSKRSPRFEQAAWPLSNYVPKVGPKSLGQPKWGLY
jgi:hypothetical protein